MPPFHLQARDALPAGQLRGSNFRVEEQVRNDGLTNYCRLHTGYGDLEVESTAELQIRIEELNGLVIMEELDRKEVFRESVVKGVKPGTTRRYRPSAIPRASSTWNAGTAAAWSRRRWTLYSGRRNRRTGSTLSGRPWRSRQSPAEPRLTGRFDAKVRAEFERRGWKLREMTSPDSMKP